MGKPRPQKNKKKSKSKSVLSAGGSVSKQKMNEDPSKLLDQAIILLQTGQADAALALAQQALDQAPANSPTQLSALNTVGEILVELGEIEAARGHFLHAVELDPDGTIPEAQGGGAEKFLWMAQLSEAGGKDSVQWFEKGVSALRHAIKQLEENPGPQEAIELEEKKRKMANALCGVAEIYMTDLSWEEDAESRCDSLITEALLVNPNAPEVLQTLASIRISQLRTDEARAALTKSLDLWKDLPPEDPTVPDFATKISLSRLLMEVSMELEALEVLERLILEDDQSVEAWYLGGWCLQLLAGKQQAPKDVEEETDVTPEARRHASLVASREWLKQSLKLYDLIQYEDERLKEHALELVQEMNKELGEDMEDDSNAEEGEDGEDWEDEIEADVARPLSPEIRRAKFIPPNRRCVAKKVQSPNGESPLKNPVVEVEAVDMASAEVDGDIATENSLALEGEVSASEYESDGGDSDEWETQSLYEDAIQVLRDEQLREGVPGACTLDEAIAFRNRLHEIGKAAFVEETIARDTVTAKKLCTAFGIMPPPFLEGAPDQAYHPLLAIAISREFSRRPKLPQYNSIDDAVKLLQESKNIVVLTGAGISTSLGIPDFRSKDTGLYSQLEHLGLSDPQEVFDIHVFREDPSIFFSIAKDILPTEKKYSPTHGFIRLLQDKGKLLTNYTQNIDNIEANAGVIPENIVQCHGSFATATCVKCQYKVPGDAIFEDIKKGVVPQCVSCQKQIAEDSLRPQGLKRKRSTNGAHKGRDSEDSSEEDDYEIPTPGVMKPDITFFGEDLPDEFGRRLLHHDREKVDLVIVIGTSLKVAPVAEVPGVLPRQVPQIYISRTYLIRFAQAHETFRRPELEALADLTGVDLEILSYEDSSPYCIVKLQSEEDARALITRSILAKDITEIWGQGTNYDELHADVRRRTQHRFKDYLHATFRFTVESAFWKRTLETKKKIIQSFSYMGLLGPIRMKDPEEDFLVIEEFTLRNPVAGAPPPPPPTDPNAQDQVEPWRIFFGRRVASSSRDMVPRYDLKKRRYIATTSMDAELSLVTANMAHAAPGKIFFDPFVGTGSFCVAAAHFGASTLGADIDGRSFRGKDQKKGEPIGLLANFLQYGIESRYLDAFTSDLTNTPLISRPFLDGIVCDPPYGVREGLRVLGTREGGRQAVPIWDGIPVHLRPGFIAPKKPYGFEAMLNDILSFAARTLVTNGRLAMWMPNTNDEDVEFLIPKHPNLEVINVSVQPFTNWSRRLITYRRLPEGEVSDLSGARNKSDAQGSRADELNPFRKKVPTSIGFYPSQASRLTDGLLPHHSLPSPFLSTSQSSSKSTPSSRTRCTSLTKSARNNPASASPSSSSSSSLCPRPNITQLAFAAVGAGSKGGRGMIWK
ncbi:SIR2-domain-containing protein [Aspergillus ambiguus]|uniref:putative histone deacetylase SIR2 n=1 Tax=Aspergillus ambiguus TaxID=176160 RepID=UPI003CCDC281